MIFRSKDDEMPLQQGMSPHTLEKERVFREFFYEQCKQHKRVKSRQKYLAVDMFAGSGLNIWRNGSTNGIPGGYGSLCQGSPLVFSEAAWYAGLKDYDLVCFEKNLDTYRKLAFTLLWVYGLEQSNLTMYAGDSMLGIKGLLEKKDPQAGHLLIDPNSSTGVYIDWDHIVLVLRKWKCMDVCINYSATVMKRVKETEWWGDILNIPRAIKRKFWYVSEPMGPFQFTVLVGRGTESKQYERLQPLYSEQGREWTKIARYTKKELKHGTRRR